MRKVLLIVATIFLPALSFASITIQNNTKFFGTARIAGGSCSSSLGDMGIIKPQGSLVLSNVEIYLLCKGKPCDGLIYPNNNCNGTEIAKVTFTKNGVMGITTYDQHFQVTGIGSKTITVNSVSFLFNPFSAFPF